MTQQQIMNFWFHSGKLQASYVSLDACVRVCQGVSGSSYFGWCFLNTGTIRICL